KEQLRPQADAHDRVAAVAVGDQCLVEVFVIGAAIHAQPRGRPSIGSTSARRAPPAHSPASALEPGRSGAGRVSAIVSLRWFIRANRNGSDGPAKGRVLSLDG